MLETNRPLVIGERVVITDVSLKTSQEEGAVKDNSEHPYYTIELDNGKINRYHCKKFESLYGEDEQLVYFYMIIDKESDAPEDHVRLFHTEDEVNQKLREYVDDMWDGTGDLEENELFEYFTTTVKVYEINASTLKKTQIKPEIQMETTVKI